MNNRRKLFVALGTGVLAAPLGSFAQKKPAKIYRVGVLVPSTAAAGAHFQKAFSQALRELGYVEGQNLIVERRYGDGKVERFSDFAAELVRIKVDMIVATTDAGIAAVRQETQAIPIVMTAASDPVGTGFVASLARPDGNVTGLSTMSPQLSAKRLELLNEVVPGLRRVALLWNPDNRGSCSNLTKRSRPPERCGWSFNPWNCAARKTSIEPSPQSRISVRRR